MDVNVGATLNTCGLTVAQWEDCVNALAGDHCNLNNADPDPLCDPFLACGGTFHDPP
jgi:hypothetical protein